MWAGICWKYLKANVLGPAARSKGWQKTSNRQTRKLGRKGWGLRNWEIKVFKSFHIFLGISAATHMPKCRHLIRKKLKALSFHICLTFRFCTNRKWKLRQSCKLPDWMLKVCPHTHTEPIYKDLFFVFWFQGFRAISIKSLTNHYAKRAETSLVTHDREYKLQNQFRSY